MIKFSELNTAKSCEGLVPAIIQDDDTRQILKAKRAATICMPRASQRTAMRIRC